MWPFSGYAETSSSGLPWESSSRGFLAPQSGLWTGSSRSREVAHVPQEVWRVVREDEEEDYASHSGLSKGCSESESHSEFGCFGDCTASPSSDQADKLEKHMGKLRWLPKWARHRLVLDLIYRFAVGDKPVPLGVVAGAAVPYALLVTCARAVFSFCFLSLVLQSVNCNEFGFAVFEWKVWLAWVPFQLLCTTLEIQSFRIIAAPKIQVTGPPRFLGCALPFYVWFVFNLGQSILGALDLGADGAFLGAQWHVRECSRGALFEAVWRDLWHESIFGEIGIDRLVPSFTVTCILTWLLNLVPLTIALLQSVPLSLVDYDICHNADPNVLQAVGTAVDFVDEELEVNEKGQWYNQYTTVINKCCDGQRQNHGAALMSLAEVNAWNCVIFDDFRFAISKAELCMAQGNPSGAIPHVLSQTKRQTQRAFGSALTNGLQLNLQMTALAMLQYDRPVQNYQSFFSISVAGLMLCARVCTAANVLFHSYRWEMRIRSEIDKKEPDKASCLKPFTRSLYVLSFVVMVCMACMAYGAAKFFMMGQCQYSLWNIRGCYRPMTDVVQLQNSTAPIRGDST